MMMGRSIEVEVEKVMVIWDSTSVVHFASMAGDLDRQGRLD
jgi:hypothetical protein